MIHDHDERALVGAVQLSSIVGHGSQFPGWLAGSQTRLGDGVLLPWCGGERGGEGESGGGGVSPFLQLRHLGRLAGFQNPSTTIEPWHFSPGPPILNSPITDGRPSAASPSGPPPWTLGSKFCTSEGPEPSPPSAVRQLGTCMCSHRPTILVSSSSPARSSRARNTARNWSSLLWLWQTRHFPRHTAVATCLSDFYPWTRARRGSVADYTQPSQGWFR